MAVIVLFAFSSSALMFSFLGCKCIINNDRFRCPILCRFLFGRFSSFCLHEKSAANDGASPISFMHFLHFWTQHCCGCVPLFQLTLTKWITNGRPENNRAFNQLSQKSPFIIFDLFSFLNFLFDFCYPAAKKLDCNGLPSPVSGRL